MWFSARLLLPPTNLWKQFLPLARFFLGGGADIQSDCHFFLRHTVGLAQVLDTFAGGVRIKVHKPALRPQSSAANRHTTGPENRQTFGGSLLDRRG